MSFILKGDRDTGTITYHCSTTRHAVDKLRDFQRAEYRNIAITTGDERSITEDTLFRQNATCGTGLDADGLDWWSAITPVETARPSASHSEAR